MTGVLPGLLCLCALHLGAWREDCGIAQQTRMMYFQFIGPTLGHPLLVVRGSVPMHIHIHTPLLAVRVRPPQSHASPLITWSQFHNVKSVQHISPLTFSVSRSSGFLQAKYP